MKTANNQNPLEQFWIENIFSAARETGHTYQPEQGQWRASQLPYCGRKLMLQKQPAWIPDIEVSEEDSLALGSNTIGQAIHEFVQNLIGDKCVAIEPHIVLKIDNYSIEGHIDLLINLGQLTIVDIKTFHRSEKYDIERYLPNPHHIEQLSIYCSITNLWNAQLLYIERNTFEPLFYELEEEVLRESAARMQDKVINLTMLEEQQILPERLPKKWDKYNGYEKLDWQCGYCQFKNYCFGSEETE